MQLIDVCGNDVSEQCAEPDEQRLRCDGEDREMGDVATVDSPSHLRVFGVEAVGLCLPEQRSRLFGKWAVAIAEFNGVVFGGIAVWKHRIGRLPVMQWRAVVADIRVEEQDVTALVGADFGDAGDALLVRPLPFLQHGRGVALLCPFLVDVDVATAAYEHQILDVVERPSCHSPIAARARGAEGVMCAFCAMLTGSCVTRDL